MYRLIRRKCKYCGKVFYVWPYLVKLSYGKYCTRRCRNLERLKDPEVRGRLSKWNKKHMTKELKSKSMETLWQDPKYREKQMKKKAAPSYIQHAMESTTKVWQNITKEKREERIKAVLKGSAVKPNKSELKLYSRLQSLFPNDYSLNVKGEVIIGRSVPDFVNCNGQKKIIELFGERWHPKEDEKKRTSLFRKFGYATLIIWESELKDQAALERKLTRFHHARHFEYFK